MCQALGAVPGVERGSVLLAGGSSCCAASVMRSQLTALMAFLHQWQRRWWWAATPGHLIPQSAMLCEPRGGRASCAALWFKLLSLP